MVISRDVGSLYSISVAGHKVHCTFEAGDWLSFVSSGRTALDATYRVNVRNETESSFAVDHDIDLATGRLKVLDKESIEGETVNRRFDVSGDARLGDFVARFVVTDAADFDAQLAGRTFRHSGRDRYLQFFTDSVNLVGERVTYSITATELTLPDGMRLACYARDGPDGNWTIHVRALSTNLRGGFLRIYWGSKMRNDVLDRFAGYPALARRLQYLRERASASRLWRYVPVAVPFQYVSVTDLSKTNGLLLTVRMEVTSRD